MNYGQMQTATENKLGVIKDGIISKLPTNFIKDELNNSNQEVAIDLLCVNGEKTFNTVINTEQYDIDTSYIENTVTRVTYDGYDLCPVDDNFRKNYAPNNTTGRPQYFYLKGQKIGLLPCPSAVGEVVIEYKKIPALMVLDSDISECPSITHNAIVLKTVYKVLDYMNDEGKDKKAMEYNEALKEARALLNKTVKERLIVLGGNQTVPLRPHRLKYDFE